jgi:hypothetical protein
MKNVSLIVTMLFSILLNTGLVSGQDIYPVPVKNGTICYEKVVMVDAAKSKPDLFSKAKQWVAQNFTATPSYNPVQLEDEENGILIINIELGKISPAKYNYYYDNITCSGKFQFKNGKYKYTFTNFKATIAITSDGETSRGDSDFDSFFISDKKPGKGDLEVLNNIDIRMKKIFSILENTLREPILDNF